MKRLLLVGGGGHCKSVIDVLLTGNNVFDKIGIIDIEEKVGTYIAGIEVIGTDADLENLYLQGYKYAFVTLGSIGDSSKRVKIAQELEKIGFECPNVIDKSSVIGKDVSLSKGIFVGKNVVINTESKIGNHAIINTGAIIEHDCRVGDFVHVAPGSVICGNVSIGDGAHIGANATLIQGIKVGANVVVGAGSTIIKNVQECTTIVGNPGRVIK